MWIVEEERRKKETGVPLPEVPLWRPTRLSGKSLECSQHNLTESHRWRSLSLSKKLREIVERSCKVSSSSRVQPSLEPLFAQSKLSSATPSRPKCSPQCRRQIPAKSRRQESLHVAIKVTQKRPPKVVQEQHTDQLFELHSADHRHCRRRHCLKSASLIIDYDPKSSPAAFKHHYRWKIVIKPNQRSIPSGTAALRFRHRSSDHLQSTSPFAPYRFGWSPSTTIAWNPITVARSIKPVYCCCGHHLSNWLRSQTASITSLTQIWIGTICVTCTSAHPDRNLSLGTLSYNSSNLAYLWTEPEYYESPN